MRLGLLVAILGDAPVVTQRVCVPPPQPKPQPRREPVPETRQRKVSRSG